MKLAARVMLMVSIVITATDVIEYIHIKQHPENLTVPFLVSVIAVTIMPIGMIIWVWHKRKWL